MPPKTPHEETEVFLAPIIHGVDSREEKARLYHCFFCKALEISCHGPHKREQWTTAFVNPIPLVECTTIYVFWFPCGTTVNAIFSRLEIRPLRLKQHQNPGLVKKKILVPFANCMLELNNKIYHSLLIHLRKTTTSKRWVWIFT